MSERLRRLRMRTRHFVTGCKPRFVRDWLASRCSSCKRRRRFTESWHSYGGSEKWHGPCMAAQSWRTAADERLAVLDLIADVWEINAGTVRELASLRGLNDLESSKAWDLAFRVFYALDQRRQVSA